MTFLTYINPPIPLTKHLFKAHMERLGAWQDLVEGKNSIRKNNSAQIHNLFVTAPLSYYIYLSIYIYYVH